MRGLGEDEGQVRGHELGEGDAEPVHPGYEGAGFPVGLLRQDAHLGAVHQREPDLPHGGVEAGGGAGEHPVLGGHREVPGHPGHVIGQRGVRHDHALGAAGRTRGVDDVRRVRRVGRVRDGHGRPGQPGIRVVDGEPRYVAVGQGRPDVRGGEQQDGAGVVEHVPDAGGRILRVDRQVGGAGAQDGQHGDDGVHGRGRGEGHAVLAARAPFAQGVGEGVGSGVELGVGEARVRVAHGDGVGGARGPFPDRLGRAPDGQRPLRSPSLAQDEVPLAGGEGVEVTDRAVGVGHRQGEDAGEAGAEGAGGSGVEEVGVVLQVAADAGCLALGALLVRDAVVGEFGEFGERERQVELAHPGVPGPVGDGDAGETEFRPVLVLQDEHGLEERVMVTGAFGVELLHHPFEGDVSVAEGGDVELRDPSQEFAEGRVP